MSEEKKVEEAKVEEKKSSDQEHHSSASAKDVEENKVMAILAYFIFFLPLLAAKDSKFAMYHANQGLILTVILIGVNILGPIIPVIGWFLIWPFGLLFWAILLILGIINAAQGQMKPLPAIGKYQILK